MSDVEKICWINAMRKRRAEEMAAAERAWKKAEELRSERERKAILRWRLMQFVQRGSWALAGAAAAMIGTWLAFGEMRHALFWVSVVIAAILGSLLTEPEE